MAELGLKPINENLGQYLEIKRKREAKNDRDNKQRNKQEGAKLS